MDLAHALRLSSSPHVIAFVGAGGKTTAMFQLAHLLSQPRHAPVILTVTSHFGPWQTSLASRHAIATSLDQLSIPSDPGILLFTGPLQGDRLQPLAPDLLEALHEMCTSRGLNLLIEADGSRQKPLKAPAAHEPPIPGFADMVLVFAGLTGLGTSLTSEQVHRPEIFASLASMEAGSPITPEALTRLLLHPQGGLKNIPPGARRIAVLNQAEDPELQAAAGRMVKSLLPTYAAVAVGSLSSESFQLFETSAGILLAAGSSSRLGRPKQLLEWHGQPFVRVIVQTALSAGLEPVIVVTGSFAEQVEQALQSLPLRLVHNPEWQEGQAASIRAGIRALESDSPGSAVFLLADQPQINPAILRALVDLHSLDLSPVVAPLVMEQRANPVLFDRITFPDLLELHGDTGGRAIFHKHRVRYLPWHDERLLLDVDTPEQYARLLEASS